MGVRSRLLSAQSRNHRIFKDSLLNMIGKVDYATRDPSVFVGRAPFHFLALCHAVPTARVGHRTAGHFAQHPLRVLLPILHEGQPKRC